MLATSILMPDYRGMSLRCDGNKLRMWHLELPVIRQHQFERLEWSRFRELFNRCGVHARRMFVAPSVSIFQLAPK
jgi:hypothetical protein